jgi:hypothetical protein
MKVVMTAAALSLMVCSAASAFPTPKSPISTLDLVQVGKKSHKKHHHAYKHGYKHPPKGWRKYSNRPIFWERRGCIVIGPGWYCP